MNILVACEESQTVCKAFLLKGHNVYSCDLQGCSGGLPDRHIISDCTLLLNGGSFITESGSSVFIDKWDMLIAHPPCTYFSKAGACRLYHMGIIDGERFLKGLEMKKLFLTLYNCDIPKICIENPTPLKCFNLPKHSDVIQPYEFGEPYSKRTCLWLKGLPPLFSTCICSDFCEWVTAVPGSNAAKAKIRSKTFPGIASAMAEQWG